LRFSARIVLVSKEAVRLCSQNVSGQFVRRDRSLRWVLFQELRMEFFQLHHPLNATVLCDRGTVETVA
jgi:hypothetical protein